MTAAAAAPADSLGRRYAYKLAGNIAGSASHMVVQALVPRAIGPVAYGDFVFLTSWFTRLVGFLGFGTPLALNTKVAQCPGDARLMTFYAWFVAGVGVVAAAAIALVFASGAVQRVWPSQVAPVFVWAAALWAFVTWINQTVAGLADAYGKTVAIERSKLWQAPVSALVVVALYAGGWLTLSTVFAYHFVMLAVMTWSWLSLLHRAGAPVLPSAAPGAGETRAIAREFYDYSHPIVVYTTLAFVGVAGERWLLQMFGGSAEQGFFGFSDRIAAISFMFTGAMTPVIAREFSIASGASDTARLRELFRRYAPLLYGVAATLCAFVATEADRVVLAFGGEAFGAAALPMAILALYPAHQTYGQLCASLFYATGQTRKYRDIGVAAMIAGMALAWMFLAPRSLGGFDAGAVGLAAKTIVLQVLAVNAQLYYCCRVLGLSYWKYAAHQAVALAGPLAAGVGARMITMPLDASPLLALGVAALVYGALVAALAAGAPQLFGLSRVAARDAWREGVRLARWRR